MNSILLITGITITTITIYFILVNHHVNQFRKNIKKGDNCRFFIDNEKFTGRIISVHSHFVKISFAGKTIRMEKNAIYP